MRLLLRNKVGMSVLLMFLVLFLAAGAFALTGVGSAAHAAGTAVLPNHHGGGGGGSGCDPKSNFFANPCVAVEDTDGYVSFVIQGQKLIPHQYYIVSSPALDRACNTSITPTYEFTDLTGRFNDFFSNSGGCIAGTYEIELQEDASPFAVYSTHVTIKFPHR